MYEPPTAPMTIGQVLDRGFSLFKASFASVWLFALVVSIAAIPFNSVGVATDDLPPDQMPLGLALGSLGFGLLYVIVSIVIFGAIVSRIGAIARGTAIEAGEALGVGFRRGPALVGAAILYTIGTVLMLFLLIIPGIWFMVAFAFAMYATILDRKGPIEALRLSFAMVRGHWWRTAALITIIGIIAGVIYILLGFIVGFVTAFGAGSEEALQGTLLWLQIIVFPLLQVVLVPLSYSLFVALYNDAKLRHEGSDLAARIDDATA